MEVISGIVRDLLKPKVSWIDKDGTSQQLKLDDILIVAPYNAHAQVFKLAEKLPANARVGTVDKFQAQEARLSFIP